MNPRWLLLLTLVSLGCTPRSSSAQSADPVFHESFDDGALGDRAWYDNASAMVIDEGAGISGGAIVFRYLQGAEYPESGGALRRALPETRSVRIQYWVRYSADWQGSNNQVHPHELYLLTNLEERYAPPAYTHLTVYIEQNEGRPLMILQDGKNVNESGLREELRETTEERAVAGCNGTSDAHPIGDCYGSPGHFRNGKFFEGSRVAFAETPGPHFQGDWHYVDAFVQLNRVADGQTYADGVLRYAVDGELLIDLDDVVFRTSQHPDMRFNQFLIGPYMSSSPTEQTFWIDELTIDATDRVGHPSPVPAAPPLPTPATAPEAEGQGSAGAPND